MVVNCTNQLVQQPTMSAFRELWIYKPASLISLNVLIHGVFSL